MTVKELLGSETHYRAFSEVLKILRKQKKIRFKQQGNTIIYNEKQLKNVYQKFLKTLQG